MGDAASQMAAQEALAAGAPGRAVCMPGMLAPAATMPAAAFQNAWAQAAQGGAGDLVSGQLQEPALLAQLVQLLGQRPRHSLLLSDLGALLPGPLRHGVKEKGGLRSWLQKYPELFQVSGYPGKESVTLLLGTSAERTAVNGAGVGAAKQGGRPGAVEAAQGKDGEAAGELCRKDDEEEENEAAVQMRGLPYRATKADVKKFLGVHAQSLKDDDTSIQLVANRDGRPSGFARVQFDTPSAARVARDGLHMQIMEVNNSPGSTGGTGSGAQDRYVEVFLYSERPNKLRIKKLTSGGGTAISEEEAIEAAKVSKEQVAMECREHMMSPGKGQLLLSMLGVALSDGARLYLKKTDQGLKQFLAQYPQEFVVDGVKGREQVSYLPAVGRGHSNSDLPVGFSEAQRKARRAEQGTGGPASGSISDLQRPRHVEPAFVPQSPQVTDKLNFDTEMATPSDWGTPQPGPYLPGFDPSRGLLPRLGADAAGGAPGAGGLRADGMPGAGAVPAGQGFEDWTAWAMPPPNFWVEPSCWPAPQDGGAALPPWALDAALGVLQPVPMPLAAPVAATSPVAAAASVPAGIYAALAPPPAGPAQAAPPQASQDPGAPAAVQLKGLPFQATEQDVLAFFAKHDVVDRVSEAPNAVDILKKPSGKPTGQAVVHMMSRTDAHVALRVLNGQYMDSRYIEVSHYTEGAEGAGSQQPAAGVGAAGSQPAAAVCVAQGGAVGAVQAAPLLQQPGVVPAGPCQAAVRRLDGQGLFDGASDTGGSGGPAGGPAGGPGLVAAFPPQALWWAASGAPEAARPPSALPGPAPTPLPVPVPAPTPAAQPGQSDGAGGEAPTPAPTGGQPAAPTADEEQERWEALFNFLKRDSEPPPLPSAAALSNLGTSDCGSGAVMGLAKADAA